MFLEEIHLISVKILTALISLTVLFNSKSWKTRVCWENTKFVLYVILDTTMTHTNAQTATLINVISANQFKIP